MIWPTDIIVKDQGRLLFVTFESGEAVAITSELLRVESPSAEVKGHGPGQEVLVPGKRDVTIKKIEPIGSYAIRLIFSDGHSTGIFTWDYLAKLGREGEALMTAYQEKLTAAGQRR
jgi:DUF971 family protein